MAVARVAATNPFLSDRIIGELSDFTISEEATPLAVGDSTGGTPTISALGVAHSRWAMASGQTMELETDYGTAIGKVSATDFGTSGNIVTLNADSVLNRLNIDVRALPYYTRTADLASDNFTRDANATSMGTAPSGQTWVTHRGVWGIQGNQAYSTTTAPGFFNGPLAGVLVNTPNQRVSARITAVGPNGASGGIVARMSDANNYVWADLDATGKYRMAMVVRGGQSLLDEGTGIALGSTLTLLTVGNRLTLLINGTEKYGITISSELRTGSWAGLIGNGSPNSPLTRWDDFTVSTPTADVGTLYNGFTTLTRLAGVPDNQVEIDPEIQYDNVIFPGFVGNLWEHIKQMCAAHKYQCYAIGNKIGLTKADKVKIEITAPIGAQQNISMGDLAQKVQITNYQYVPVTQGVFFKADQVYSLEAGESQEVSVKTNGTVGLVNTPVCVAGMDLKMTAGFGQYVVTGDDGYIMAPALWRDLGGSVSVRLSDEAADEIIITMKAPDDPARAPYRLSEGDDRPALWITGAGVQSNPVVHTIHTGAVDAPQVMTDPVENVFVANRTMAYNAGAVLAGLYSGPTVTLTLSGVPMLELVRKAFTYTLPPQGTQFAVPETELPVWVGSLAGALLRFGDAIYRVQSASVKPTAVDLTCTQHTTFDDFDQAWAGRTFGDFNTALGTEIAFEQLNIFPLTAGI